MRAKILAAALLCVAGTPAYAQSPVLNPVTPLNNGQPVGSSNPLPVAGSFSASLGGFHWAASLPPMTNLGTSPVTQAITAGQTIVIQNIGATNSAFCALGGTTSANATFVPPISSYSLTSISETSITCVTSASTTTLNLQTGTGLWTNAGGGGGSGGGGGTVAQGTGGASAWLVTGTGGTFPVTGTFWQTTQPISVASLPLPSGAATSANQTTEIGSLGTIATNSGTQATAALQTTGNTSLAAIAAAAVLPLPAQTGFGVNIGAAQLIDANSNAALVDPCQSGAKTYTPINIVTAANTKIVAGTASKKTYICGLFLYPGATDNIAIIEGSGTNCGTSPLGLIGGNTAATGIIATAQAGFVLPTTGYAHAASTVNANDFCLITSAAVQLSGVAVTVAR